MKKLKDGVVGFPTMRYVRNGVCENYEDCTGITPDRSYGSFKEWIAMKEKRQGKVTKTSRSGYRHAWWKKTTQKQEIAYNTSQEENAKTGDYRAPLEARGRR